MVSLRFFFCVCVCVCLYVRLFVLIRQIGQSKAMRCYFLLGNALALEKRKGNFVGKSLLLSIVVRINGIIVACLTSGAY